MTGVGCAFIFNRLIRLIELYLITCIFYDTKKVVISSDALSSSIATIRSSNYCEFISSCHHVGVSNHGSWMIAAWHAIFATNDAYFDLFSLHFIFSRDEMMVFCSDKYN